MFFTTVKNWYWYLGKLCVENWIRQLMLLQTTMGLQQKNLFSWVNYQPGQFPDAIILYGYTGFDAFSGSYMPQRRAVLLFLKDRQT